MKQAFSLVVLLSILLTTFGNTYYSTSNSSPNSTSNWRTNRNGTGASPSNFNGNNDVFIVQTGHTVTTTGNWNVNGNNAKIIIEGNGVLRANHRVSIDIFQVDDNGKYIHNDNSSSFPGNDDRILAANSTVEIRNWNGSTKLPANLTWGNLVIDMPGYGSHLNQAGDLTDIAGDFIIRSTGNSGREFRLASNQDYTLVIGGDLVIEGGILEAGSSNANADQVIIINGSFIQSAGTFTRSNNNSNALTIAFNGTNSHFTQPAGTLTSTYMNWRVNASKTLVLDNDIPLELFRSFTVNGTLDLGNKMITGAGSFIINTGGMLITSHTQGLVGSLNLTGPQTFNSGASYEFRAATVTPFPVSLVSIAAANIIIGADVSFNKNAVIAGTLTINNGKAIIPSGRSVTISSGNAVAGSGFGVAKHIVTETNNVTGAKGYFRIQNFTGTRIVPVGNGSHFLPVTLTVTGINDFTIVAFAGITANGEPNGTNYTAFQKQDMVDAVWNINRNAGSGDVMLQMAWPSVLEGPGFQTLPNGQIGVSHYGSSWEPAFGTGDQVQNIATRTAVVSFSAFTVARGSVPLPVRFGDMKAVHQNSGVFIGWSSFTELGVSHYEIERSTDGRNFSLMAWVPAAGNSNSRMDYSYTDPVSGDGIFFYRIKAVDADSKFTYSNIARINVSRQPGSAEMLLYPNPVTDKRIIIEAGYLHQGIYSLKIYDQGGRLVFRQDIEHTGGSVTRQVQLAPAMQPGIYTLSMTDRGETKKTRQFVIQ